MIGYWCWIVGLKCDNNVLKCQQDLCMRSSRFLTFPTAKHVAYGERSEPSAPSTADQQLSNSNMSDLGVFRCSVVEVEASERSGSLERGGDA